MPIDLAALPDDPATLQRMLREVVSEAQAQAAENDKLRLLIQRLLRHRFGRRSEQLAADQLQLALEDLEQTAAESEAAQEAAAPARERPPRRAARPRRNLGDLPAHRKRCSTALLLEPG